MSAKFEESVTATAERVVSRLLDGKVTEDFDSMGDYDARPGGPKDPLRQVTIPVNLASLDATGRRGVSPFGAKTHDVDLEPGWDHEPGAVTDEEIDPATAGAPPAPPLHRHGGRFQIRFPESRGSAACNPGKAIKKGKTIKGAAVAGKPGKVSYKESLMRSVLEKIKMKKQGKGKMVAGKPGKISYKGECKGVSKKKKTPTVAKAPGKVSHK